MGATKSKCTSSIDSVVRVPKDDKDDMSFREMYEREQGRKILRDMVTSSKQEKIDWEGIIAKAQELHQREQKLIKQRENKLFSLFIYSKRKKEMRRRHKADSCGSFGVNLLTVPSHKNKEAAIGHKACSPIKNRNRTCDNSISSPGASIATSTSGTISANRDEWDDCIFTRNWDEGMTPIFENEI